MNRTQNIAALIVVVVLGLPTAVFGQSGGTGPALALDWCAANHLLRDGMMA